MKLEQQHSNIQSKKVVPELSQMSPSDNEAVPSSNLSFSSELQTRNSDLRDNINHIRVSIVAMLLME
ncbi:11685_t:CDS:2 [Ambispora gerdemannii]|uniref:11685_t:CDS:1 n=1 Tax=Ambispora gerdemannii TaxID=144530 RepID=A0A9N8VQY8_9GLOM|nr:11685_t:CDS:2 [Ambispora gerdemannii]